MPNLFESLGNAQGRKDKGFSTEAAFKTEIGRRAQEFIDLEFENTAATAARAARDAANARITDPDIIAGNEAIAKAGRAATFQRNKTAFIQEFCAKCQEAETTAVAGGTSIYPLNTVLKVNAILNLMTPASRDVIPRLIRDEIAIFIAAKQPESLEETAALVSDALNNYIAYQVIAAIRNATPPIADDVAFNTLVDGLDIPQMIKNGIKASNQNCITNHLQNFYHILHIDPRDYFNLYYKNILEAYAAANAAILAAPDASRANVINVLEATFQDSTNLVTAESIVNTIVTNALCPQATAAAGAVYNTIQAINDVRDYDDYDDVDLVVSALNALNPPVDATVKTAADTVYQKRLNAVDFIRAQALALARHANIEEGIRTAVTNFLTDNPNPTCAQIAAEVRRVYGGYRFYNPIIDDLLEVLDGARWNNGNPGNAGLAAAEEDILEGTLDVEECTKLTVQGDANRRAFHTHANTIIDDINVQINIANSITPDVIASVAYNRFNEMNAVKETATNIVTSADVDDTVKTAARGAVTNNDSADDTLTAIETAVNTHNKQAILNAVIAAPNCPVNVVNEAIRSHGLFANTAETICADVQAFVDDINHYRTDATIAPLLVIAQAHVTNIKNKLIEFEARKIDADLGIDPANKATAKATSVATINLKSPADLANEYLAALKDPAAKTSVDDIQFLAGIAQINIGVVYEIVPPATGPKEVSDLEILYNGKKSYIHGLGKFNDKLTVFMTEDGTVIPNSEILPLIEIKNEADKNQAIYVELEKLANLVPADAPGTACAAGTANLMLLKSFVGKIPYLDAAIDAQLIGDTPDISADTILNANYQLRLLDLTSDQVLAVLNAANCETALNALFQIPNPVPAPPDAALNQKITDRNLLFSKMSDTTAVPFPAVVIAYPNPLDFDLVRPDAWKSLREAAFIKAAENLPSLLKIIQEKCSPADIKVLEDALADPEDANKQTAKNQLLLSALKPISTGIEPAKISICINNQAIQEVITTFNAKQKTFELHKKAKSNENTNGSFYQAVIRSAETAPGALNEIQATLLDRIENANDLGNIASVDLTAKVKKILIARDPSNEGTINRYTDAELKNAYEKALKTSPKLLEGDVELFSEALKENLFTRINGGASDVQVREALIAHDKQRIKNFVKEQTELYEIEYRAGRIREADKLAAINALALDEPNLLTNANDGQHYGAVPNIGAVGSVAPVVALVGDDISVEVGNVLKDRYKAALANNGGYVSDKDKTLITTVLPDFQIQIIKDGTPANDGSLPLKTAKDEPKAYMSATVFGEGDDAYGAETSAKAKLFIHEIEGVNGVTYEALNKGVQSLVELNSQKLVDNKYTQLELLAHLQVGNPFSNINFIETELKEFLPLMHVLIDNIGNNVAGNYDDTNPDHQAVINAAKTLYAKAAINKLDAVANVVTGRYFPQYLNTLASFSHKIPHLQQRITDQGNNGTTVVAYDTDLANNALLVAAVRQECLLQRLSADQLFDVCKETSWDQVKNKVTPSGFTAAWMIPTGAMPASQGFLGDMSLLVPADTTTPLTVAEIAINIDRLKQQQQFRLAALTNLFEQAEQTKSTELLTKLLGDHHFAECRDLSEILNDPASDINTKKQAVAKWLIREFKFEGIDPETGHPENNHTRAVAFISARLNLNTLETVNQSLEEMANAASAQKVANKDEDRLNSQNVPRDLAKGNNVLEVFMVAKNPLVKQDLATFKAELVTALVAKLDLSLSGAAALQAKLNTRVGAHYAIAVLPAYTPNPDATAELTQLSKAYVDIFDQPTITLDQLDPDDMAIFAEALGAEIIQLNDAQSADGDDQEVEFDGKTKYFKNTLPASGLSLADIKPKLYLVPENSKEFSLVQNNPRMIAQLTETQKTALKRIASMANGHAFIPDDDKKPLFHLIRFTTTVGDREDCTDDVRNAARAEYLLSNPDADATLCEALIKAILDTPQNLDVIKLNIAKLVSAQELAETSNTDNAGWISYIHHATGIAGTATAGMNPITTEFLTQLQSIAQRRYFELKQSEIIDRLWTLDDATFDTVKAIDLTTTTSLTADQKDKLQKAIFSEFNGVVTPANIDALITPFINENRFAIASTIENVKKINAAVNKLPDGLTEDGRHSQTAKIQYTERYLEILKAPRELTKPINVSHNKLANIMDINPAGLNKTILKNIQKQTAERLIEKEDMLLEAISSFSDKNDIKRLANENPLTENTIHTIFNKNISGDDGFNFSAVSFDANKISNIQILAKAAYQDRERIEAAEASQLEAEKLIEWEEIVSNWMDSLKIVDLRIIQTILLSSKTPDEMFKDLTAHTFAKMLNKQLPSSLDFATVMDKIEEILPVFLCHAMIQDLTQEQLRQAQALLNSNKSETDKITDLNTLIHDPTNLDKKLDPSKDQELLTAMQNAVESNLEAYQQILDATEASIPGFFDVKNPKKTQSHFETIIVNKLKNIKYSDLYTSDGFVENWDKLCKEKDLTEIQNLLGKLGIKEADVPKVPEFETEHRTVNPGAGATTKITYPVEKLAKWFVKRREELAPFHASSSVFGKQKIDLTAPSHYDRIRNIGLATALKRLNPELKLDQKMIIAINVYLKNISTSPFDSAAFAKAVTEDKSEREKLTKLLENAEILGKITENQSNNALIRTVLTDYLDDLKQRIEKIQSEGPSDSQLQIAKTNLLGRQCRRFAEFLETRQLSLLGTEDEKKDQIKVLFAEFIDIIEIGFTTDGHIALNDRMKKLGHSPYLAATMTEADYNDITRIQSAKILESTDRYKVAEELSKREKELEANFAEWEKVLLPKDQFKALKEGASPSFWSNVGKNPGIATAGVLSSGTLGLGAGTAVSSSLAGTVFGIASGAVVVGGLTLGVGLIPYAVLVAGGLAVGSVLSSDPAIPARIPSLEEDLIALYSAFSNKKGQATLRVAEQREQWVNQMLIDLTSRKTYLENAETILKNKQKELSSIKANFSAKNEKEITAHIAKIEQYEKQIQKKLTDIQEQLTMYDVWLNGRKRSEQYQAEEEQTKPDGTTQKVKVTKTRSILLSGGLSHIKEEMDTVLYKEDVQIDDNGNSETILRRRKPEEALKKEFGRFKDELSDDLTLEQLEERRGKALSKVNGMPSSSIKANVGGIFEELKTGYARIEHFGVGTKYASSVTPPAGIDCVTQRMDNGGIEIGLEWRSLGRKVCVGVNGEIIKHLNEEPVFADSVYDFVQRLPDGTTKSIKAVDYLDKTGTKKRAEVVSTDKDEAFNPANKDHQRTLARATFRSIARMVLEIKEKTGRFPDRSHFIDIEPRTKLDAEYTAAVVKILKAMYPAHLKDSSFVVDKTHHVEAFDIKPSSKPPYFEYNDGKPKVGFFGSLGGTTPADPQNLCDTFVELLGHPSKDSEFLEIVNEFKVALGDIELSQTLETSSAKAAFGQKARFLDKKAPDLSGENGDADLLKDEEMIMANRPTPAA